MASAQPPFEYLISSSEESLESFELSRLSHVSNLRKELRTVLDEFVEAEIQARIARWILEGRRAQDHDADHDKDLEYASLAPRTQKPGPHKSLASQSATRARQNSLPQHVDAADRIEQAHNTDHDIDHDAGNDAGGVAGNGDRETEVREHGIRKNETRRPARAASQLPLFRATQSPSPEATPARRAIVSQDPSMILRSLEHCAASAANALASCAADVPGRSSKESARRMRVRGASHPSPEAISPAGSPQSPRGPRDPQRVSLPFLPEERTTSSPAPALPAAMEENTAPARNLVPSLNRSACAKKGRRKIPGKKQRRAFVARKDLKPSGPVRAAYGPVVLRDRRAAQAS
jgi:hypothetical protein